MTIVALDRHPVAACFAELDDALRALDPTRTVYLNAHTAPDEVPSGGIVLNTENVPGQVADPRALWPDAELWDISASNAAKYGATHVPVGYHASMERFTRSAAPDIDVVFTGCLNERRRAVLQELADHGLSVCHVPPGIYGAERDALLARSKLALNMQFYADGIYPVLRVAHLVANGVPVLSEAHADGWSFVASCDYAELVDTAVTMLERPYDTERSAWNALEMFRCRPMVLPS